MVARHGCLAAGHCNNLCAPASPLFRCPSQGDPVTSDLNQMTQRYVTNYLACAGGDATQDNLGPGGMDRSNGMFRAALFNRQPQPPTRLRDVTDGTSPHAAGQ